MPRMINEENQVEIMIGPIQERITWSGRFAMDNYVRVLTHCCHILLNAKGLCACCSLSLDCLLLFLVLTGSESESERERKRL